MPLVHIPSERGWVPKQIYHWGHWGHYGEKKVGSKNSKDMELAWLGLWKGEILGNKQNGTGPPLRLWFEQWEE